MFRNVLATILLAGWALMFNPDPDDRRPQWRQVGHYATDSLCERALTLGMQRTTEARIGGALASQPPDNPMREEAYARANFRAQKQYRCVSE
jgi:hypothetical protein